jgi:DNA-binding transcriptional LysR family regulator
VNFRHLSYFIAVAEELNFRRAAERLHIVQPGLSQQISRMESELGLALLERTKRRVELTDAGQVFLGEARALLERYEQAVTSARQAAAGQTGSLAVGFVGPAIYSVLHTVARAYLKSFPNVSLVLHELNSAEQLDRIIAGTLDVGFVRLPVRDKRVLTMQLISEPIIIVLPEGHPEAARDVVNLAALADEPFVMVPRAREPNAFDRYIEICAKAGFSPRIGQEVLQIHTIVEVVAMGLGVALAPASLTNLRRPGVAYRPLRDLGPFTTDTGLVWGPENPSAALRGFIATASESVADYRSDADRRGLPS